MKPLSHKLPLLALFGLLAGTAQGLDTLIDPSTANGGFEASPTDAAPWAVTGATSVSTTLWRSGTNALLQAPGGGFSVPTARQIFPTQAGDVWDFSGYMLTPIAMPATVTFALLKIVWLDENGAELPALVAASDPELIGSAITGANPGIESTPFLNSASAPSTWILSRARGTAPTGATQVSLILLTVDQSACNVYFDDITALGTIRGVFVAPPPAVSVAPAGSDIDLTFDTKVGKEYTFEASTDLATWGPVGSTLKGSGDPETVTLTGAAPAAGSKAFFQVTENDLSPAVGEILVNGGFNMGTDNLQGWEAYAVWNQPKGTYIFESGWGLADAPVVATGDGTATFAMNTQLAAADPYWHGGYQNPMSLQQSFWSVDGPKSGNVENLYGQVVTFTGNIEITQAYDTGVIANVSFSGGTVLAGSAGVTHVLTGLSGSLSGTGAALNIRRDGTGAISQIRRMDGGTGFTAAETILIPGSLIGGTNGVDDLTINVIDVANSTVEVFLSFLDTNFQPVPGSVTVNVTNQGAGVIPFNLSGTCPPSGLNLVQVGFRHIGVEGTAGAIRVSNLSVTAANP